VSAAVTHEKMPLRLRGSVAFRGIRFCVIALARLFELSKPIRVRNERIDGGGRRVPSAARKYHHARQKDDLLQVWSPEAESVPNVTQKDGRTPDQ
jgi:hypothetical protein